MLFDDDFIGVSESRERLQKLIDIVYGYRNRWRLKANVGKSAVMVFCKDKVEGRWKWGEYELPTVSNYCYLGIDQIMYKIGKGRARLRHFIRLN